MLHRGAHAVVNAFNVHLKNAIKIPLGGSFEFADVRDPCIVYQGVDWAALGECLKYGAYILVVGHITFVGRRIAAGISNFPGRIFRAFCVNIENLHTRATRRKKEGDRTADTARASRDDCRFAVEAKPVRILDGTFQRNAPA